MLPSTTRSLGWESNGPGFTSATSPVPAAVTVGPPQLPPVVAVGGGEVPRHRRARRRSSRRTAPSSPDRCPARGSRLRETRWRAADCPHRPSPRRPRCRRSRRTERPGAARRSGTEIRMVLSGRARRASPRLRPPRADSGSRAVRDSARKAAFHTGCGCLPLRAAGRRLARCAGRPGGRRGRSGRSGRPWLRRSRGGGRRRGGARCRRSRESSAT